MKAGRIVGILLFVLLVLYILLFHAANPVLVTLPWLSALLLLPVSYMVVLALVVGFLVGWLPARLLAWRRGREVRRLEKRVAELEPQYTPLAVTDPYHPSEFPVIPDRGAQQRTGIFEAKPHDPFDDAEAG